MNYELRSKLNELVHQGLLDREQYDSLVEVLAEASRLMPQYCDDVHRTEQLLDQLVQLVQQNGPVLVVRPPEHVNIGVIAHVGLLTSSHLAAETIGHLLGRHHVELPRRHCIQALLAVATEPLLSYEQTASHLRPYVGPEDEPPEPPVVLFFREKGRNDHIVPPKSFPRPHFDGYMNRRRGKGR